jgi:hypothetical protein
MSESQALIPPPAVVRQKLARTVREAAVLRSLLRLSVRVAEDRHYFEQSARATAAPQTEAATR